MGLFPLKLYFYDKFPTVIDVTASLSKCRRIVWTK